MIERHKTTRKDFIQLQKFPKLVSSNMKAEKNITLS